MLPARIAALRTPTQPIAASTNLQPANTCRTMSFSNDHLNPPTQTMPEVRYTESAPAQSWMQLSLEDDESFAQTDKNFTTERIWFGMMTTRLAVAVFLLTLQILAWYLRDSHYGWLTVLCALYLAATLTTRLYIQPVAAGQPFERYWPITIGLDLSILCLLLFFDRSGMANYTPLLALPPVICAVLGSWRTTLLTVLLSSLLLGASSLYQYHNRDYDEQILHYAIITLYVLAMLLVTSVLHRLVRNYEAQQIKSLHSQKLARLHTRIQDMVMQNVRDGVLVVGSSGRVRAINQTAKNMLKIPDDTHLTGKAFTSIAQMTALEHLIKQSFEEGEGISSEVLLFSAEDTPTHLMVRIQLSAPQQDSNNEGEAICLLYLQDMQELQNQIRAEKLAAMGRMSAAVAHEIRNPLAAIGQAAQLLNEEAQQPFQKKLNTIVLDNVQRINRIVSDVLDIARMQPKPLNELALLPLDSSVQKNCEEWQAQNQPQGSLQLLCSAPATLLRFDAEHLRRIIFNLLDNAQLHAQQGSNASIVIATSTSPKTAQLHIWSRGAPLPDAVQARLFEPLAAGSSRTSGLGLYICRELCQRHQADIHYHRLPLQTLNPNATPQAGAEKGNTFTITFPVATAAAEAAAATSTDASNATDAPPHESQQP